MPGTQDACGDPLLNARRQAEQPDGIRDVRPGPADLPGQLLVRGGEVIEKLLIRGGLLERVQLLSVQVLDQRVPEQLVVRRLPDNGRDRGEAGLLAGAPPALAHDELIVSGHDLAHDDRLQQADGPDRRRELLERLLVEDLARLTRVGRYCADRYLIEVGTDTVGLVLSGCLAGLP